MPLAVTGYQELMRAFNAADKDTKRDARRVFKDVGESVRADASRRAGRYSARTAAGYRVYVRQKGIAVGQSLSKTTGKRPDFGALQMRRILIPARSDGYQETQQALERALDQMADRFNSG